MTPTFFDWVGNIITGIAMYYDRLAKFWFWVVLPGPIVSTYSPIFDSGNWNDWVTWMNENIGMHGKAWEVRYSAAEIGLHQIKFRSEQAATLYILRWGIK